MKGICANELLCTVPIRLVARAWGFLSRRDIVLNLLWKRKGYKLIQVYYTSTHFEMFSFVILPFDFVQGERAVPLMWAVGDCRGSLKGCGFLKTFWPEIEYRFWSFWSHTGYGFCTPVLNCLLCSVFCRRRYVVFHHYR